MAVKKYVPIILFRVLLILLLIGSTFSAHHDCPNGNSAISFPNGVHTIHRATANNAWNTDGMGSRYYTMQNTLISI